MFKSIGLPEILVGIVAIAILAILIWGIIRIISGLRSNNSLRTENNSLEIARQRYAKGEISKEQFEQLKKDLS